MENEIRYTYAPHARHPFCLMLYYYKKHAGKMLEEKKNA